jgi:hypothetical protein
MGYFPHFVANYHFDSLKPHASDALGLVEVEGVDEGRADRTGFRSWDRSSCSGEPAPVHPPLLFLSKL